MDTETTETGTTTEETGGKEAEVETVAVPKADYDKLNQTLGSLKRELKDLKKPKEEPASPTEQKTDSPALLQKSFLRAAGITDKEEVELALSTAKKWGIEVDALVDDEDFQAKLGKLRTQKSNELATSGIRAGAGSTASAKNTPEYWLSKGTPPTEADAANIDRKSLAKIMRGFMAKEKGTGANPYYNG